MAICLKIKWMVMLVISVESVFSKNAIFVVVLLLSIVNFAVEKRQAQIGKQDLANRITKNKNHEKNKKNNPSFAVRIP